MIDLVWFNGGCPPPWTLGRVHAVPEATPPSMSEFLARELAALDSEALLFWDGTLGAPDAGHVRNLLDGPGDVWHAGLRLGLSGAPGMIDFVQPTWMLNRDPDAGIRASSWRISLRACLMRTDVLRQMGGPRPEFLTLDSAGLEMGHRLIQSGVFVRHEPELAGSSAAPRAPQVPISDELRFVRYRFGPRWALWAAARALVTGYAPQNILLRAWASLRGAGPPPRCRPFRRPEPEQRPADLPRSRVSVVIPTLERYPYLRTVLSQLREQTITPLEVLVVDQTPVADRDPSVPEWFPELPLKVLYLDTPGQCSSRNCALHESSGDFLLFIDDDDEIRPDLIERHLLSLARFRADVSSGVADEAGAGPLPQAFTLVRTSDVFPTNNTLIRRRVLEASGLFDLAYDRGQRADRDLGTRIYLCGAMMVLNPAISVFHHHAPRGGLRAHRARVITYASSRRSICQRHLPSTSEIYLSRRYFTPRQAREALRIGVLGTFSIRGSWARRGMKLFWSALFLPSTLTTVRRRVREAVRMLDRYPQIPRLPTTRTDGSRTTASGECLDDRFGGGAGPTRMTTIAGGIGASSVWHSPDSVEHGP